MTDTQPAHEAPPLNFTNAAAHKVGQLIEQEGNSALKLRVYVQGGGCSGFQYGFTFDEEVQEGVKGDALRPQTTSVSFRYSPALIGRAMSTWGRLAPLAAACSLS